MKWGGVQTVTLEDKQYPHVFLTICNLNDASDLQEKLVSFTVSCMQVCWSLVPKNLKEELQQIWSNWSSYWPGCLLTPKKLSPLLQCLLTYTELLPFCLSHLVQTSLVVIYIWGRILGNSSRLAELTAYKTSTTPMVKV